MTTRVLLFLILLASIGTASHAATTADLNVSVTGVKKLVGSIRISVFDSSESFQKEPFLSLIVPADSDTVQFKVDDLKVGEFAVMLFHDLDSNEKLKTNLIGIPREPWGASSQGKSFFGPPKWKNVVFEHTDTGTELVIGLN